TGVLTFHEPGQFGNPPDYIPTFFRFKLTNGFIKRFFVGVSLGPQASVEDLHVSENLHGIFVDKGALVRNNEVFDNGLGIGAGAGSIVMNNRVEDNDLDGIAVDLGSIVVDNVAARNALAQKGRAGVRMSSQIFGGALIFRNQVMFNGLGIDAECARNVAHTG